jgi:hypothetical protein
MKSFIKLFFVIVLFSLVFTNINCKKTIPISYEGTVYDSVSSAKPKPLVGATVLLSACNGKIAGYNSQCNGSLFTIESATTDGNGHFSIQSSTKLRSQAFYVGVEGSPYTASNRGYSLTQLPTELYKN